MIGRSPHSSPSGWDGMIDRVVLNDILQKRKTP